MGCRGAKGREEEDGYGKEVEEKGWKKNGIRGGGGEREERGGDGGRTAVHETRPADKNEPNSSF